MKILFLHGWHSAVGGVKPTYLKSHGHEVFNPKLDDDDFEAALNTAQGILDNHPIDVIVGSSRGGAVALNIRSAEIPLVLLCPAWKKWGTKNELKPNSFILHSRKDDVIAFEDSEELIEQSGLPTETLLEVGNDHRLADNDSLSVMLWACSVLLTNQLAWTPDELQMSSKARSPLGSSSESEASYVCDACGEEIVIPIDVTEGEDQRYVEDCPVCCRANIIHIQFQEHGGVRAWAEPEQDYD